MAVENSSYPKFKYTIASTGQPGVGYKLFTYEEGTSTKKTTWTSAAKTAENTNPIILDANGEADVWIDGDYKFVLAPPTDTDPPTSPVWSYDAIRSPLDSAVSSTTGMATPSNGSFEADADADGQPDSWTIVELSGGAVEIDTTTSSHAASSLKFTSVGAGAGYASTSDFYNVPAGKVIGLRFDIISSAVDTLNKVQVSWYDSSQAFLSTTDVYSEGAANPTSWTRNYLTATVPANGRYAKIVLTGVDPLSTTHGSTWFDNIELDTKFTGELTTSAAEINKLDGATVTTAEINYLDLTTGPGTQEANKAVVADSNVNTGVSKVTQLHIGASGSEVQVTATPVELNYSVGVTSSIQTQINNTNTTSNILTLYAGATAGAVGTYAFAYNAATLDYVFGDTIAGSNLSAIGLQAPSTAEGVAITSGATTGAAFSGTWRCMGHSNYNVGTPVFGITLWLRTA